MATIHVEDDPRSEVQASQPVNQRQHSFWCQVTAKLEPHALEVRQRVLLKREQTEPHRQRTKTSQHSYIHLGPLSLFRIGVLIAQPFLLDALGEQ
jgi:hypothetical protein